MGLAKMPFAPARELDVSSISVFMKMTFGVGTPGAAEVYAVDSGVCGELAVVEDIGAVLRFADAALRGDVASGMRGTADLAMVEERLGVAKDEIDIAFNEAVGEILPRRRTRRAGRAMLIRRVQGILIAQEAHIAKDRAVSGYVDLLALASLLEDLGMMRVEVVLEGQVLGDEVVSQNVHGSGLGAACRLPALLSKTTTALSGIVILRGRADECAASQW